MVVGVKEDIDTGKKSKRRILIGYLFVSTSTLFLCTSETN